MALTACSSSQAGQTNVARKGNHEHVIDVRLLRGSYSDGWPVFGYDAGHTGYGGRQVDHQVVHGHLIWSKKIGPIFSSLVAGLGMLFISSTDGNLYAFRED